MWSKYCFSFFLNLILFRIQIALLVSEEDAADVARVSDQDADLALALSLDTDAPMIPACAPPAPIHAMADAAFRRLGKADVRTPARSSKLSRTMRTKEMLDKIERT